jgi:apolipoprotein N-acyltransferase
MDFPKLSRQYGQTDAALLLVPAWDFHSDGWLHDRMAVVRGIESGFSIARSAKQGLLSVSDNRGRILAERTTDELPFSELVASVPIEHVDTLYARFGDWFAWLDLIVLAALFVTMRHKHLSSLRKAPVHKPLQVTQ